jgi:hypothetical protein
MLTSSYKRSGMDHARPAEKAVFDLPLPSPRAPKALILFALGALAWGLVMLSAWALVEMVT